MTSKKVIQTIYKAGNNFFKDNLLLRNLSHKNSTQESYLGYQLNYIYINCNGTQKYTKASIHKFCYTLPFMIPLLDVENLDQTDSLDSYLQFLHDVLPLKYALCNAR